MLIHPLGMHDVPATVSKCVIFFSHPMPFCVSWISDFLMYVIAVYNFHKFISR
jgi:hypothetical protein